MARDAPPVETWELRLATSMVHPVLAAVVVAVVALSGFLVVRWLSGAPLTLRDPGARFPIEPSAIAGIVLSVLLGYMIFGVGFSTRARERELARIGVAGGAQEDLATVRRSRLWGALGAVLGLLIVTSVPGSYGVRLSDADADYFWFLAAGPLFLWMVARAAYFSLRSDATLEALRARPIDLLDLEPVRIFGRLGVQQALVWLIGISLATPIFIAIGLSPQLLPIVVVTSAIAFLALALPVRGLRARIRDAKRAELERAMGEVRALRDAALEGDPGQRGRLADLLAYHAYLDQIRESPIDLRALVRFGVYLLIPLGSWFASALVERFVDSFFE